MTEHAALGASSCYRWWACPGSIRMAASAPPSVSSRFALEGTAAHGVLAWCLTDGAKANNAGFRAADEAVGRDVALFLDADDAKACHDVGIDEVTDEMAEGVQMHIDYVLRRLTNSSLLLVEHRVDLTPLSKPAGIKAPMFGTADTILFQTDTGLLETIDFKYGRGVFVAAEGNPQLRYYGVGALLDAYDKKRPVQRVKNTIIQPRCGGEPIRSEDLDPIDLYDWHTELLDAALRTGEPDAPLVAGDWCGFCPAAGSCPAQRDAALAVVGADFAKLPAVTVPAPSELALPDLVRILDGLDLLDDWANAVRAHAKALLDGGVEIPGWRLGERVGHRKWKAPPEDEQDLKTALEFAKVLREMGVDLVDQIWEKKLKSPARMEKLLTKAQRESAAFKALWHKPVTGTTMVKDGSAAAPVQPRIASDFKPTQIAASSEEESLL